MANSHANGSSKNEHAPTSEPVPMEVDEIDTYSYVKKIQELKKSIERLKTLENYVNMGHTIVQAAQLDIPRIKNPALKKVLTEWAHLHAQLLTELTGMKHTIEDLENEKERINQEFIELLEVSTRRENDEERQPSQSGGETAAAAFGGTSSNQPDTFTEKLIRCFQDLAKLVNFQVEIDSRSLSNPQILEQFRSHVEARLKTRSVQTGEGESSRPVMRVKPTIVMPTHNATLGQPNAFQDREEPEANQQAALGNVQEFGEEQEEVGDDDDDF